MKYLKRFNEALNRPQRKALRQELDDFCSTHLAYLADDGYSFRSDTFVNANNQLVSTFIFLKREESDPHYTFNPFSFDEVKDKFIPFVYHLKKKYHILEVYKPSLRTDNIIFTCRDEDNRPSTLYYNIEDLDTVSLDNVVSISFYILLHEDQK
jgi:hypothetical protein